MCIRDRADADYFPTETKWGYINQAGKVVVRPEFDDNRNFHEGLAAVRKEAKWGYINQAGDVEIPLTYKSVWGFIDGLAKVQTFDNKMGFIDTDGNWIIEPTFDEVTEFSEDRAVFRNGINYGFIDKRGKVIIPAEYERAYSFKNGLAKVKLDNKYGLSLIHI